jgi:hypothetical protein
MNKFMGLSQNRTCGSSHPAPPGLSPLGMEFIVNVDQTAKAEFLKPSVR